MVQGFGFSMKIRGFTLRAFNTPPSGASGRFSLFCKINRARCAPHVVGLVLPYIRSSASSR
jgi:hypothetical protein